MTPEQPSPEVTFALESIWSECIDLIIRGVTYAAYIEQLRELAADTPEMLRKQGLDWPTVYGYARVAWCNTPHPELGYAVIGVPKAERNAPCPCGSGRKYKQCCGPLEKAMPPMTQINLLPMLLEDLPRQRWAELVGSRVPLAMVGDAAMQMVQAGDSKEVCTLLEPWFVDDVDFCVARADLLHWLLEAYDLVPHPRKKKQLLARAMRVGDAGMQSAAWQRQAMILADQGDYEAAWALFTQAQRADPASTSLSHMEVTLLLSEGRVTEARERARFWMHRFKGLRDAELEPLIDFLRQVAEQGAQGVENLLIKNDPALHELVELMHAAPPVASLYTLGHADATSAGPLQPKRKLQRALDAWDGQQDASLLALEANLGVPDDGVALCLPVLRAHPELWNAFEVLGTVVEGIQARGVNFLDGGVLRPLLERAEALLHEVLRANHAEGKTLEWGWLPNRPALQLLGERIQLDGEAFDDPTQVERLQWIVTTLNPNDNQGFRDMLVRAYLSTGRLDEALAVCARYAGDFASMQYNHALALYAAERRDEALEALREALVNGPKLVVWLLKKNPKPPRLGPYGVTVGGDDEAWFYRQDTQALWEKLDAMDWLRKSARALK